MAFEIKKRAQLTDDVPEKSHEERVAEDIERRFIQNDRATFESIMSAYEDHRAIMESGTQDDRIMHYATLHVQRGFASYLIGEGFIEEENRINGGNSQYKSLNHLFDSNESRLPFDKKTMYQYIQIAKAVSFDDFKKLGVKKTLIVAQVKDDKKREQIIKAVSDKKMDESKTREYVNTVFEKEMARNRVKKETAREEAFEEVKYDVIATGSATDIMLRVNRKYKDAAANVLLAWEARFKIAVMEEYKKQTGK